MLRRVYPLFVLKNGMETTKRFCPFVASKSTMSNALVQTKYRMKSTTYLFGGCSVPYPLPALLRSSWLQELVGRSRGAGRVWYTYSYYFNMFTAKKIVDISKSVKIYGPQALSKCARMEWKATSGIAAVV